MPPVVVVLLLLLLLLLLPLLSFHSHRFYSLVSESFPIRERSSERLVRKASAVPCAEFFGISNPECLIEWKTIR